MSLFSFKPEARSLLSKVGKPKLFLFFGAIVVLILGNTLAANISLNSGGNVEFGQGVALTTACDNDVTVTPYSTFVNEEGAGDFMFTSISVTGISEDCDGKIFTIKAYEEGSDDPLDLYITGGTDTYNSVQVSYSMSGSEGTFTLVDAGLLSDDIYDRERDDGSDSDGFTVELFTSDIPSSEALASARDVDRITIESRDGDGPSPSPSPTSSGDYSNYEFGQPAAGQSFVIPGSGSRLLLGISDLSFKCRILDDRTSLSVQVILRSAADSTPVLASTDAVVLNNSSQCGVGTSTPVSSLPVLQLPWVFSTPYSVTGGESYYFEIVGFDPEDESNWQQGIFALSTFAEDAYPSGEMYVGPPGYMYLTTRDDPTWQADIFFQLNFAP